MVVLNAVRRLFQLVFLGTILADLPDCKGDQTVGLVEMKLLVSQSLVALRLQKVTGIDLRGSQMMKVRVIV